MSSTFLNIHFIKGIWKKIDKQGLYNYSYNYSYMIVSLKFEEKSRVILHLVLILGI